jgi:hypothetical protein
MGRGAMSDSSTLCVGCGLCCNGALFTAARAEPDEMPRLQSLGLEVEPMRGGGQQFRLPCRHHDEGRCGIYADRFLKCRTFRCALLKRLDEGELGLGEAQSIVIRAKAMLARVAELDPAAAQFRVRAVQRTQRAPAETAEAAAKRRRLLIESLALDLFFDQRFRNRPAVRMDRLSSKPEGEEN